MGVTNQALPSGYQLLNYRIDRQISRGGFSIVYRAFDDAGAPVAIKEYLPSSLVLRTEGDIVRASSAENLTSFRYGMKCFFEEGRALAKINHPNVVRVLNFFRANETVHGDALRARAHAAAADPAASGPDVRTAGASRVHAPAERLARSTYAQASASRHQAGQRVSADRREPGSARFRRCAADTDDVAAEARADVHAGLCRARATAWDRTDVWHRREHVRLLAAFALGRRRRSTKITWCRRRRFGPALFRQRVGSSTGTCGSITERRKRLLRDP